MTRRYEEHNPFGTDAEAIVNQWGQLKTENLTARISAEWGNEEEVHAIRLAEADVIRAIESARTQHHTKEDAYDFQKRFPEIGFGD